MKKSIISLMCVICLIIPLFLVGCSSPFKESEDEMHERIVKEYLKDEFDITCDEIKLLTGINNIGVNIGFTAGLAMYEYEIKTSDGETIKVKYQNWGVDLTEDTKDGIYIVEDKEEIQDNSDADTVINGLSMK